MKYIKWFIDTLFKTLLLSGVVGLLSLGFLFSVVLFGLAVKEGMVVGIILMLAGIGLMLAGIGLAEWKKMEKSE